MNRSKPFDLDRIAKNTGMTSNIMKKSLVSEEILAGIYNDYLSNRSMLEKVQADIMSLLNEKVMPTCHSIRSRIKDAEHLIAKIVRNANQKGGKYLDINRENYLCRVNDLIGVRIMVMRQKDFKSVHEAITSLFENDTKNYIVNGNYDENIKNQCDKYIAEMPVVYVTSENDKRFYKDIEGLEITSSKESYRSIHYIVRYKDIFFEIQVRTLFEEGWLEFDHTIKYPNDNDNPKKADFLRVLNCLAIAADEFISLYDMLEPFMNEKVEGNSDNHEKKEIDIDNGEDLNSNSLKDKILSMF